MAAEVDTLWPITADGNVTQEGVFARPVVQKNGRGSYLAASPGAFVKLITWQWPRSLRVGSGIPPRTLRPSHGYG